MVVHKNRVFAGLFAVFVGCSAQSIHAFGFDDLEKVEKVEQKERRQREARAEAARREEEARRQAQQQAQEAEARQRAAANNSGGSNRGAGTSVEAGGRYRIYEDKGRAAAWSWFKQEILVKCEGGRKNGDIPSVYLNESGRWSTTYRTGTYSTFHEAATAACQ
ncbi:MAG: hypothetical protein RIR79_1471 [Pseudomonadota bacterium]|jgi:hypothetical protein